MTLESDDSYLLTVKFTHDLFCVCKICHKYFWLIKKAKIVEEILLNRQLKVLALHILKWKKS